MNPYLGMISVKYEFPHVELSKNSDNSKLMDGTNQYNLLKAEKIKMYKCLECDIISDKPILPNTNNCVHLLAINAKLLINKPYEVIVKKE